MQTLDPSPKEKLQEKSSQPMQSSPSTSVGTSKMSEVNKSLSTLDNSPVSIKLNEPGGSKKLDSPNEEGQYDRLYTSLKALVTKVVSQFRKSISDEMLDRDPISYQLPQNNEGVNVSTIKTNPSSSVEVKTRAKSTLVGEETVSFLLPSDCLIRIDLDKDIQHQSSFKERFQGWHISCRQRENGKLDMNYRHGQSSKMFRSTVEVVQFIMEAFNDKETPGSSSLQEQGPATEMKGSSKKKISSSKKERIPPSKSLKISSEEKIVVEQFLEESDNNLNNICESEEWEKYLKSSNENEDNASSDEETQ